MRAREIYDRAVKADRERLRRREAIAMLLSAGAAAAGCALRPCELRRGADLPEILTALNRNSELASSLMDTNVRISGRARGQPFLLSAKLALEKPRRFRLVAYSALPSGGPEVDLGSNDELFWFWVARAQPPALYHCRHDAYAQAGSPRVLPLDPSWIVETLGIEALDPGDVHEGPIALGGGRLELRTRRVSPQGQPITKVVVLDACRGWILEQHLFDGSGQHLAGAVLGDHRREESMGVVLPHRIELSWPQADLALTLVLRNPRVNQISDGALANLWTKPSMAQEINLCDLRTDDSLQGPIIPSAGTP